MGFKLRDYLNDKFQNKLHSSVYIRFELGDPHPNGSDERIDQVYKRSSMIFESIFSNCEYIYLLIRDWDSEDCMFGNTTPNYLYEVFDISKMETEIILDEDEDCDSDGTILYRKHKEHIVRVNIKKIDYIKILKGIGNYEQGREPSIGQSVFFIDTNRHIIFNMYDDRGCDVFSLEAENIRFLYEKYNEWILDYNREEIDSVFG